MTTDHQGAEALMPCPWCGSIVLARENAHMFCVRCGADGPDADEVSDEAARAAWNRRPAPADHLADANKMVAAGWDGLPELPGSISDWAKRHATSFAKRYADWHERFDMPAGVVEQELRKAWQDEKRALFELIDALAAAKVPRWLPIEQAPKDGMFLGWVAAERWSAPDGGGSGIAHDVSQVDFCWWSKVADSPEGGYFDNGAGQIGDAQDITHFMPLPAAPGGGENAGSKEQ